MSLLKEIGVVSVPVTNWAAAREFYQDKLGLPVAFDLGEEVGWCEFGGGPGKATLALNLWRDGTPPRGGVTPIFNVDDCQQASATLRERGVKVDDPVTIPNMVIYANVYDPEGNTLQIAQSLYTGEQS
jgi:predicted enzyme related to lactoylglutathione lyase